MVSILWHIVFVDDSLYVIVYNMYTSSSWNTHFSVWHTVLRHEP